MKAIIFIFVLFALCSAQMPTVVERYPSAKWNAGDAFENSLGLSKFNDVPMVLNGLVDLTDPFFEDHDVFRQWTPQDTIKLFIWYEETYKSPETGFYKFDIMLGLAIGDKKAHQYYETKKSFWYDTDDQIQLEINFMSMFKHVTECGVSIEKAWK